jgi:Flp pilus assembly protein TadG
MKGNRTTLKRQAGSILALIAISIVPTLAAGALSVDVGFFLVARNQLQNAVDAAALAGAQGLVADPSNFSDSGQAKRLAIDIAGKNVMAGQPVTLQSSEITFPDGNTVQVQATRPVRTFFGALLGKDEVQIGVSAACRVAPVTGVSGSPGSGARPWAILDQFAHGSVCVPPNDADNPGPHGAFDDQTVHTWNGVAAIDKYTSPYDEDFDGQDVSTADCGTVSGLISPRDVDGSLVRLKSFKDISDTSGNGNGKGKGGNGNNGKGSPWLTPGNFGAIALGGNGASNYRDNIADGYQGTIHIGDIIPTEPGNMVGPTIQGVSDLILQDPTAKMVQTSSGRWQVTSSLYPVNESPRIVPIPVYGPYYSPSNGRSEFKVVSFASFFIEGSDGFQVWGRFVQVRMHASEVGTPPQSGTSQSTGGGRLVTGVRMISL